MTDETTTPTPMRLLEVRDLTTNDLLTTYDTTDVQDLPSVIRGATAVMPDGACLIVVDREQAGGELSALPEPIAEDAKPQPAEEPTA